MNDIELIFIDDCGTERSAIQMIKKASEFDKRIILLQNSHNIGAGNTRNRGIAQATGQYLAFVDPDDYIAEDFLELLYRSATINGTEIAKGSLIYVNQSGKQTSVGLSNYRIQSGLKNGLPLYSLFSVEHTTAIYSRELVIQGSILYGESSYAEDRVFLFRICNVAKTITFEKNAKYFYVSRTGSSIGNLTGERLRGEYLSCKEIIEDINSKCICTKDTYSFMSVFVVNVLTIQKIISEKVDREEATFVLKDLRDFLMESPYAEELARDNIIIGALLKYNKNLSVIPYNKRWYTTSYNVYRNQVITWVRFLCNHQEYCGCCYPYIWQVFEYAIDFDGWDLEKQFTKKKSLKELRMLAHQLPDRRILTKDFLSMKLFVEFNINTFMLRQTLVGNTIQKAKLRLRDLLREIRRP